ncbi:MAG: radical SAM protein [Eubacterium sp.]|nr:radical SAM protein [Eubacterium sp.]
MDKSFDIQKYMTHGVENVVADAIKATRKNPRESAFMVRFAAASRDASRRRAKLEKEGEHVPPFLITSITSSCNLHCEGCYSRCNNSTTDNAPVNQLSDEEWGRVFDEAEELGVSFILVAGGEPMLRRGVIEAASKKKNILFPVFTNGTFMTKSYFNLFDMNRNIVPIMSIEGDKEITDARRGEGIYDRLISNMDELQRRGIIFGASVTVTTDNYKEVTSNEFISKLSARGCKAVIYVEYVPVTDESAGLAPTDGERQYMNSEISRLRNERTEMVFISFPGDEKSSGGCIAAGRGFFHINSHGDAEPCPFSPYSDTNVRDTSLREAMKSKFFRMMVEEGLLGDDHNGGCVLFEKRDQVQECIKSLL